MEFGEEGKQKPDRKHSGEDVISQSAETLRLSAEGKNTANDTTANAVEEPAVDREDVQPEQESGSTPRMSRSKVIMIMFSLATIVTTALPTIVEELGAAESDYTWIGSAYLLASAASSPSWGKISDIFGRKPILLTANLIFLVGSLLCGVSKSSRMLIGGRVVQGLGGGGLLSLVNVCIGDLFSIRERSMMYATIGIVLSEVSSDMNCVTDHPQVPADGIALVAIFFFLRIETPKTPLLEGLGGIDWFGSLTSAGGTVMFLLGLNYGGDSFPWASATVVCLIVFGIVTWALFMSLPHPRIFGLRGKSPIQVITVAQH
ncbi:hypothetical protein KEM54_006434 [Ascosphaera aggregata]|nr:hypothetical protein KEM54_006434 [Ascosphaera aggregata]